MGREHLSFLRRKLPQARNINADGDLERARALLLSGENDEALKILEKMDDPSEAAHITGLALWNTGLRQRAIEVWMREFRNTGEDAVLARIYWALERREQFLRLRP